MYQQFLISDFKTAKFIGKDAWLAPPDAFPTLINAQVNKGVLEKRNGFSLFAQMKHGSTPQTTTTIMGIGIHLRRGMPKLLICDTKRINLYYPVDGTMTDISGGSDIFTGKDTDFFHFCNWLNICYFVNNKNQIYKYNGSGNAEPFNYRISSLDPSANHLTTCRFIFQKDSRLLFLDTVEFGDWYPNRCRYTPVLQTDGLASGAGSVDAPTSERIVVAGRVGKDIAVWFENSLWRIRSTGNSDIPLKWEKVTDTEGAQSPYSGVEFADGLAVIGLSNILFYDGFKIKDLDMPNLRDVLAEFSSSKIRYCFGYNQKESRHILFSYAAAGSTYPDRILDYNFNENNFTEHKSAQTFFVSCIGGFNSQKVPILTDLDLVHRGNSDALVSDMDVDSRAILGNPAQYTLIGCRNSRVYKWSDGNYDGTDDTNGKIELDIRSARLNPFVQQNRKCALGEISFLVDYSATASFTVSLYKNHENTAWRTRTLDCSKGSTSAEKNWVSIFADGEIAQFHMLKISHLEKNNKPRIHAIMLDFEPAGLING